MAINIKFDLTGNPEPPTIILANRNGNKLGQLKVNEDSIDLSDKFNDASELSFTVNKYIDGELTPLWGKLVDFKLVWCKEWDTWFEIKVELDEETEVVKTVFCTQLGQSELSQVMLHNIEINTEEDISRDDYKITILYDDNDVEASLLNRLLKDKAPHYSIAHVDETIKNIQRTFSFDGTSIKDAFDEIAEEIGCLFVYNSGSNENGSPQRTISVYDLQQNCLNPECKHRGEFTDKCPKCDGINIKHYGEDTLIFVTSDELASKGIQFTTDTDSVKNCFRLEAGDDLMTATVRNCNPNGSNYIWRFSDMIKEDMSDELVEKIDSYNDLYKDYYETREYNLNTTSLNQYNALVEKYKDFYNTKSSCLNCKYEAIFEGSCPQCGSDNVLSGKNLESIHTTITGYPALMNAYYNTIDLALYLQSGLMPSIQMSETNAAEQLALLTNANLSSVAVNTEKLSSVSLTTANSAVLSMAKIIVKSTYKVEIVSSSISADKKIWSGKFVVTNYSDDTDTATSSNNVDVTINNDTETFIKQKIEKTLNKEETDDYSISGLFEKEIKLDEDGEHIVDANDGCTCPFCQELKKYALNPLKSFYDACDSCIDVLIENNASDKNKNPDLYKDLYLPYYRKSSAIAKEITLRENEITVIEGVWDKSDEDNPRLTTKGLQQYIEECRSSIQNILNFENYLGADLWKEFYAYRREDVYSNNNYVSDGLNNTELFEKALEFIEVAENEIYKSSELQCSISTSLNNLLAIDKFKPLINSFELGNWIRVLVDDQIYKLRLIEYGIDFGSFENISVEFSDVTKIKNGITDIESVLSQASSMATSYSYTQRQAKQGDDARNIVGQWLESGLNSANVKIKNNNNEEAILGKNGLLCRSYDDVTDTYSPEQFRLTHNIMAYTTDNWKTVSAALGKHDYEYYIGNYDDGNQEKVQGADYGLSARFVTAGYVSGSQIIGGEIYSQNYTSTTGTYLDLNNGKFSWAGGKIKYDGEDLILKGVNLTWEDIGDAPTNVSEFENDADYKNGTQVTEITTDTIKTTNVMAQNLQVKAANIDGTLTASQINTIGLIAENISGTTLSGKTITGGSINIGNGNFVVTSGGVLTAKSGDFTGKIISTSGSIANWDIDTNTIKKITTKDNKSIITGIQQPNNGTYAFFAGTYNGSNFGDCEFRVTHTGKLYASNAYISGDSTFSGNLSAAGGTFSGKLSAVSGTFTSLSAGKSKFLTNQVVIDASYTDSNGDEISKGSIYIGRSGVDGWEDITIRPSSDNLGNIGTAGKSWDMLYVKNGAVQSSDRNYKTNISTMGEKQEQLFNLLNPVTFKFIDSSYDRYHFGFISQEVEDAIYECGLTTKDFAGFCKDVKRDDNGELIFDENGNQVYIYSLRYNEFIALNTHMIQKLQSENNILKERIDSLENMIKQLS